MNTSTREQSLTAPISEIFFSYQGEGIYLGQPQIFIRFSGCNINCGYCDTKQNSRVKNKFLNRFEVLNKVLSLKKRHFGKKPRDFKPVVSLTGGEPLLYAEFIKEILPLLKKKGFQIYLETNGTLPESLKRIIGLIDVIAMDIKLPSDCKKTFWKQHLKFLKLSGKKAIVKTVITKKTTLTEIAKAVDLVSKHSKHTPFILQPVTSKNPDDISMLHSHFAYAKKKLSYVFVIPQMHKFWGIK